MAAFISRTLEQAITTRLTGEPRKIVLLYGQRQVGKTTLAKHILEKMKEYEGNLAGFEFKFGNKEAKTPAAWQETYPQATFQTINRDNWLRFVLEREQI